MGFAQALLFETPLGPAPYPIAPMMAFLKKTQLKSHYVATIPVYNAAPSIDRHGIQAPPLTGNWQDARLRR